MITVSGWCEGAAGGYRGFEKDFFPNSLRFLEKKRWKPGAYSSILQTPPKRLTPSFGGDSHLGVPCRVALLERAEWEGEKTSRDQYPKNPWIS